MPSPLPEPKDPGAVLPWEDGLAVDAPDPSLPGVSIVIPIFNAGAFLEKTIRSLMCNNLDGVELILMDGGSTDDTRRIVARYEELFAHAQFEKDEGQSDAINKGFARATQPILYWLNGDDLILPNTLNAVRACFRDNPGTEVVVGNAYMTEKDFTIRRHFVFAPEKLTFEYLLDYAAHHLIQPSVFFTRTAWEAAGPLKREQHYAMDADLFLGMARRYPFRYLPLDLAYSVYHEECKTRGKRAESITELALVQAAHGGIGEARRTLDILVDLFNEQAAAPPAPAAPMGSDSVLRQRLATLEAQVGQNREALLDLDLGRH